MGVVQRHTFDQIAHLRIIVTQVYICQRTNPEKSKSICLLLSGGIARMKKNTYRSDKRLAHRNKATCSWNRRRSNFNKFMTTSSSRFKHSLSYYCWRYRVAKERSALMPRGAMAMWVVEVCGLGSRESRVLGLGSRQSQSCPFKMVL